MSRLNRPDPRRVRGLGAAIRLAAPKTLGPAEALSLSRLSWRASHRQHLAVVFPLSPPFLCVVGGAASTPGDCRGDLNFSKKFWRAFLRAFELAGSLAGKSLEAALAAECLLFSSAPGPLPPRGGRRRPGGAAGG